MKIQVGLTPYGELNAEIRRQLEQHSKITLEDVHGQRYLGCAMDAGKTLEIHGTPGNDLACYLNGGNLEVFGNGQDAVGNTMNGGKIVIHGHAGDALGYAMRDGEIYVEHGVSCRGGIHMKEFGDKKPVLVIGGTAGAFLGEYMAGGTIVLLGLNRPEGSPLAGAHCASGMHGGKIFVRGAIPENRLNPNIRMDPLDSEDREEFVRYVKQYCRYFQANFDQIMNADFYRLTPATSRPYANLYTPY